jgi:AraC-like DNA-binding protein
MSYREHAPPPQLAPWLACVWEREGDGGDVRVVPDGCIDVLWTQGAGVQIVGANSTAFVAPVAAGTRVVGARMRPGAAPALIGVDAEAVRDARFDLQTVWGDEGARLAAALERSADPVTTMLRTLAWRRRAAAAPDPLVGAAIARLRAPDARVAALPAELAVSERQLRRRVVAAVGYGPKRLARVLRLQRALSAARRGDELAAAALDAGYADQAHFANDCRALAGVTPTALLR